QCERTRNGTTFDTAVRPSSPRAIATRLTCSFGLNFAGSRNARYGGSGSTARRSQVLSRRTANATLTGAPAGTRAVTVQSVLWASGRTTTVGRGGAAAGIRASAVMTTAASASTRTVRSPRASLRVGLFPSSRVHADDGVAVRIRVERGPPPLLKATTVSRLDAGSIRLTTSSDPV